MKLVDIFTAYFQASQHYVVLITPYALHLWWLLMVLELATIGITWMMGSDDPPELLWRVARWIFTGGFAYWWIVNAWPLGITILGSFNELGVNLTGMPNLAPYTFLKTALRMCELIMSAPSSGRLIPDFALRIEEFLMSGAIFVVYVIVAGLALFTLTAAFIVLAGGIILVPFLVNRFTAPIGEGYFTWLVKTGVVIFFFYLVLGIANAFVAEWGTGIATTCGAGGVWLPSPLLGAAPVIKPSLTCTIPIPMPDLMRLFADSVILAIIAIGVPFTAGAIVNHGVNAAVEHLAAAKYLAGSVATPVVGAIGALGSRIYKSIRSDSQRSTLEQRLAAGAAAAAKNPPPQSQVATQQLPKPPAVNSFGVQRTQTLPKGNGAKPTSRI